MGRERRTRRGRSWVDKIKQVDGRKSSKRREGEKAEVVTCIVEWLINLQVIKLGYCNC